MAKRIAISNLNASTLDILNTIRANANPEYQSMVPEITKSTDIPKVGEVLFGYPALANQFVSALVNRIAFVNVKSATFNNAYAELKKGYLEFGETVEEVFVNITKAREFSSEKAAAREFKRSLPDVKTAFHAMNWRVQYPITISEEELRTAFLSIQGVQDLIARIVSSIKTAAEYDEYLLFKYLIIKAVAKGKMYVVPTNLSSIDNAAINFRGLSNMLTFLKTDYNDARVHNNTPKSDQYIFMDATFNAKYDVNVLSAAFNMDKADFSGHLKLIDDFTTFDNERFSVIRENSDMLEEVTEAELSLMDDVCAVLVDKEWFQVYDIQSKFTEKYVASGEYWNYFYNVWKTVSSSPFSNAVVFVDSSSAIEPPASISVTVSAISKTSDSTVISLSVTDSTALNPSNGQFVETETAVENGVAVHPYGAIIIPTGKTYTPVYIIGETEYTTTTALSSATSVGATITLTTATTPVE